MLEKRNRVLVLGAGNSREMRVFAGPMEENPEAKVLQFSDVFNEVVTIDMDPASKPTILWDLEKFPWPIKGSFDEVHGYDVLEHLSTFDEVHAYECLCALGEVGNFKFFFKLWQQIHDALKSGGIVCATAPWWQSIWAWQDPGHKRVYSAELLGYLNQAEYTRQIGKTAMTDYRAFWPKEYNFVLRHSAMTQTKQVDPVTGEDVYTSDPLRGGYVFVLQKVPYEG